MPVKALYPACRAEDVPGLAAAEAIARRLRLAIRQPEGAFGHDQVQIAGHRADRAVAVQHFDICRGKIGLEMDEAAMAAADDRDRHDIRSEEHTSELQSLMRISYAVLCLNRKTDIKKITNPVHNKHT